MINRTRSSFLPLGALVCLAVPVAAQMVSPAIDRPGEPFSYFARPTDEIGIMDAEAATEVTPEGFLRTGYGELMFFAGPEMRPIGSRIRTLEEGHLPVLSYHFQYAGVTYTFTMFGTALDMNPQGTLVNFIRIEMKNDGKDSNRAVIAAGMRYDAPNITGQPHGEYRFNRPREPQKPGGYRQIGEPFSRDWVYSFTDNSFLRDGRMLYGFPSDYSARGWTLAGRYNNPPDVSKPGKLDVDPTVPVGIVTYSRLLKPGEQYVVDLKMPVKPTADPAQIAAIRAASYDTEHAQTVSFWKHILAQGMQITLPEAKPVETFYTSLVYDLIARDHLGPDYIQTVNKLQYHSFYLRDGADIVHSYDVTGYPDIARQDLDFFAKSQTPDGNFLSQPQQYDGWGEAVWAYAQHYRITHDKAFAEAVIPQIARAVDWLKKARASDPLHIIPASDVRDNENVPGHLTGYNFLALSGLNLAIPMARDTGHENLGQTWQAEYDDYRTAFLKVLDARAAANNGVIPPALDGQSDGYDWGNMLAIDYEPILDPGDSKVTATLKATQAKYREGIMTYANGQFLHHYLTIKNTLAEVIRGDQEQAVHEFYGLLLHTSSTHAGFEYAILPWGDRNFQDNLAPHGWFAADYRTLLRNMLIREEADQLHLLSVISPDWIGAGKTISIRQAPTYFGPVAFTLDQPSDSAAVLKIDARFDRAPKSLVVHLPWFVDLQSATADGRPVTASHGALTLPSTTREVRLHFKIPPDASHMNYEHVVDGYKAEYTHRYNLLMHGVDNTAPPTLQGLHP